MNEKIIAPPRRTRRYYLHSKVKRFLRIDVYARTMYYTEDLFDRLTIRQVQYFLELQMKFNYTAQQEII